MRIQDRIIRAGAAVCNKAQEIIAGLIAKIVPSDPERIVFLSFHGRSASDNPWALYKALCADPRYKDFKKVWLLRSKQQIPGSKTASYSLLPRVYELARAGIWISNCRIPFWQPKKKEQIYIQTWHGTPLKKIGCDTVDNGGLYYRSRMSHAQMCSAYHTDASKYDLMLSPNSFCTTIFPGAFKVDPKRILTCGYPRNDLLCVKRMPAQSARLKKEMQLPEDKKIILYAPTYRDNQKDIHGYTCRIEADFTLWKEKLQKTHVVVFKPHYSVHLDPALLEAYKGFVWLADPSADISALYWLADLLITDYSSVFFDYLLLKRPVYFWMPDFEQYKDELRGFYLQIPQDLPGLVYTDQEKMLDAVRNGETISKERMEACRALYSCSEDGHSSQRVLDALWEMLCSRKT